MTVRKRGLGRGLEALLPEQESGRLCEVHVDQVRPAGFQPRRDLNMAGLEELASSIRTTQGLLQPILVRQQEDGRFEIIAGERRWRAAQMAGLKQLPVQVVEATEEAALAMALIENIQREDLNAMETAIALKRLREEFSLTHQEIADRVGKSRVTVTNLLRLTNLEPDVAEMLERGDIEMGHARALLGPASEANLSGEFQTQLAREVADRNLSVRQTEQLVKRRRKVTKPVAGGASADTRSLEDRLSQHLGQPVAIHHTTKGKGRLVIAYTSLDELEAVIQRLGCNDPE